jgi:spore coat protein CotF
MRLAQHELEELKELTMSCMNTITNMAYFLRHAQDPELKKMLESHLASHVQDYNIKVEFISKPEGAQENLQYEDIRTSYKEFSQPPTRTISNMTPRTSVTDFNDKEIAGAYLLTLKRAGREYA